MIWVALVVFGVAAGLTPVLARWARARGLLDVPNPRSSHAVATPRLGGVAIVAAVAVGVAVGSWTVGGETTGLVIVGLAGLMALIGFIDDLRPLPAVARLLAQVAIAVLAVTLTGAVPVPWIGGWAAGTVTVFWIVAMTNAYNFMDGIDGLAGVQGLVAGVGWAVAGALAGWGDVSLAGLMIACACAGFLLHNWQPAVVFLGDAGSAFLGFLFATIPAMAPGATWQPWVLAAIVVWPFLFDTGLTLLRRLRRRENLLRAHRSHLYQRLTGTGWSHRTVALLYGVLASLGAGVAVSLASGRLLGARVLLAAIGMAAVALWCVVVWRESTCRANASKVTA